MYLEAGQAAIIDALFSYGGSREYVLLCKRPDCTWPEVKLSDYAFLEAEGYITWNRGVYTLTEDGTIEAQRRANA